MDNGTLEKIRALFAMAEHTGSNENEAALAMERAQALLLKNNLTRADIQPGETTPAPAGIGQIDGIEDHGYTWKRVLLSVLAKANLCSIVVTPSRNQWHLFGTYENVKAVLEMYHWLTPELESIGIKEYRKYKDNGGYESGIRWKHGFFLGATTTIRDRLQRPLDEFTQGNGRAIVLYNDKALSEAVKRVFPILGHSSVRSTYSEGLGTGRNAGASIHLREQRKLTGYAALTSGR